MKYKFLIFLLILASNCFATNFQLNFVRINEKLALDTLDEYGYDVEADTVANYLNKPIQHLMKFQNDTIQLSISIPKSFAGYYKWNGFTISKFYIKSVEATFKGLHAAILSPVTMTANREDIADSIYTDRLLIIEYKNKRWVYANIIRNTEGDDQPEHEDLSVGKEGLKLSYMAGQGYKYCYNMLIAMSLGQPCLMNLLVEENNATAQYQATHQYNFTPGETESYSLYKYRRNFPMLLRNGNYDAFLE